MSDNLLNYLLFRRLRFERAMKHWSDSMQSESAEGFLSLLLNLMGLVCLWNINGFRKNVEGFNGKYLFKSRDNSITVSAVFEDGKLSVSQTAIDDAHIVVNFRNGKALMDYILSPKPDILGSMLRQDVALSGNLNYLYKFAYMAKRLQLMATGAL